jgi:hypothetical protein
MKRIYKIDSNTGLIDRIHAEFPGRPIRYGEIYTKHGNKLYFSFDDHVDSEEELTIILKFGAVAIKPDLVSTSFLLPYDDFKE